MNKNELEKLIENSVLNYPSAKEWMWNYCTYLGPFTDDRGDVYDLGISADTYKDETYYSAAIVFGNEAGDYLSGDLDRVEVGRDCYVETIKRAKLLGIMK